MSFQRIIIFIFLSAACISCLADGSCSQDQYEVAQQLHLQYGKRTANVPKSQYLTERLREEIIEKNQINTQKEASPSIPIHYQFFNLKERQKQQMIAENGQQYKLRLLQQKVSIQTDNIFIRGCCILFQYIFALTRNLIIIGLLTNTINLFLPYLLLTQSFLMIGFWTCSKHYLNNLYAGVFSSYWDIFNALRLISQPISIPNLPQLAQYGFSSIILFNLMGELFVTLLLLGFTLTAKLTTINLKYEWMRKVTSNLRPIWNSYFFAIFPRVATFTGLHFRNFGHVASIDTFNGIICSLLTILMVFYFVMLMLQTKRVGSKAQTIEENQSHIGLLDRIDYSKQFNLDCLQWSNIYLPCMNYVRLFVYFFPIGLLWNCQEISYGGPIVSQLFMVMIETTSPGYFRLKDKIIFPVLNFLMVVVQLCVITIGLAQSAPYPQLSQKMEIALFSIMLALFGTSISTTCNDCWRVLKKRCMNEQTNSRRPHAKNDTTHRFVPRENKVGDLKKTEINQQKEKEQSSQYDQKIHRQPSSFNQNTSKFTTLRIKRVRTGKAIISNSRI